MESDGELESEEGWVLRPDAVRTIEVKIDIRT
jgi:hypothetical protein